MAALAEVLLDARDWGPQPRSVAAAARPPQARGSRSFFRIESETTVGYATEEVIV